MKYKTYIHYGSNKYDKKLFQNIKNCDYINKPDGGLWASPKNSNNGWLEWVCNTKYHEDKYVNNCFEFTLKSNTKLLYINNSNQLATLPKIKTKLSSCNFICLDFEKLQQQYDAIEVSISSDKYLYWDFYGWDVDTLLVLNPYCIKILNKGD